MEKEGKLIFRCMNLDVAPKKKKNEKKELDPLLQVAFAKINFGDSPLTI